MRGNLGWSIELARRGWLRSGRVLSRSSNAVAMLLSAWAAAGSLLAARAGDTPQSAVWIAHDLVVRFENLPTRYSCDDLRHKSRDVLEAMGARVQSSFPYQCDPSTGSAARSPQIRLRFWFPELVSARSPSTARLSVVRRTVKLKPGNPPALSNSDCELLRQLKNALLPAVPLTVTAYRLACAAPTLVRPPFELTVSTLAAGAHSSSELASAPPASSPE